MEIDIYLDDLKPEVQKRVLRELGLKSAKDGNYDVFPLLTLVSGQTGQDESSGYRRIEHGKQK